MPNHQPRPESLLPPAAPRDPELAQAEAEIARTRSEVAGNLLALRREVARRTDWREWVRGRPFTFLGASFLLGIFIGSRRGDDGRAGYRR